MPSDLKTQAIVLRRTNYGETDRILNLLTPEGKRAALAKGVRKEKSKLAGGIELFAVTEVVIHYGKSELGTLTSARMRKFYKNILGDLVRLEMAAKFLKKIDKVAEQTDNVEFFEILKQVLGGLDEGMDPRVVEVWFALNVARATGEELNLYRDTEGAKLSEEGRYFWDQREEALRPDGRGDIGAREIKLLRLMLAARLATVGKIEKLDDAMRNIELFGRI